MCFNYFFRSGNGVKPQQLEPDSSKYLLMSHGIHDTFVLDLIESYFADTLKKSPSETVLL